MYRSRRRPCAYAYVYAYLYRPFYRTAQYMYLILDWHLSSFYFTENNSKTQVEINKHFQGTCTIVMSHDMRFPTMWYVRQAKPQIRLRIHTV